MAPGNYQFASKFRDSTNHSRLVMRYLEEMHGCTIRDLTDDMEAQKTGIDFLVNDHTAEFKSDTRIATTGNIAFELISNSKKATAGCALTSQAELLYYYDQVKHVCHVMNFKNLRSGIETSGKLFKTAVAFTPVGK